MYYFVLYELWAYAFEALKQYYLKHTEFELYTKVVDKLLKSYEDQGDSGHSYGVATQAILGYLNGNVDDDDGNYVM